MSKIRVVVDVISRTPDTFGETRVIFPMGHPHKRECLQEIARHLTTYGDDQSREEAQAINEANRTDTTMVKPPWVLQAEAEQRESSSFGTAVAPPALLDIVQIAKVCHETNRAYCQTIGDHSQQEWDAAPDWQRKSAINQVKFHLESGKYGKLAGPSASHDSWLKEKEADGWKYGEVKDPEKKEHPCFVPYDQLPMEQRMKDYLFGSVVNAFANCAGTFDYLAPAEPAAEPVVVSDNDGEKPLIGDDPAIPFQEGGEVKDREADSITIGTLHIGGDEPEAEPVAAGGKKKK